MLDTSPSVSLPAGRDRRASARVIGRAKLAARRARVRRIRTVTVTVALVGFFAVWALIFGRLVTGHDPSLSAAAQTSSTAAASQGAATVAGTGGLSSGGSATGSGGAGGSTAAAAPVTTRQS